MKFVIAILLTALATALLQTVMPWWSLILGAFAIGMVVSLPGFQAFFSGLLGTALVWWLYAWIIDVQTDSILSNKIAEVFKVGSPAVLILLGGVLAGIVGGFAAASGTTFRKAMK